MYVNLSFALCRVCALSSASAGIQEGPRLQEEYNPGDRQQSQVRRPLATGLSPHNKHPQAKTALISLVLLVLIIAAEETCQLRKPKSLNSGGWFSFTVSFMNYRGPHLIIIFLFYRYQRICQNAYNVDTNTLFQKHNLRVLSNNSTTLHDAVPQVLIFPEGTCTNRSCLITFKQGKI